MKKNIVFFEAVGGSDKGADGHRKDTMPMVDALKAKGWNAEVVQLTDEALRDSSKREEIYKKVRESADGYVSRVNPGNLKEEKLYFDVLRKLCADGLVGMPHPDAMIGYGAKDALTKLADTPLVPSDTYAYYDPAEAKRIGVTFSDKHDFKKTFPKTLAKGERVLKQNRGSTGEGIWRVRLESSSDYNKVESLPLDTKIICTEAKDNHTEERKLGEFMDFCEHYLVGDNGMLVDMTFLPRIKEGEIRILMLYKTPVYVVHKKPAEGGDAFSATLFSGAKYRYDEPKDWQTLVDWFLGQLPQIKSKLGNYDLPLIWTADFILDTDEKGADRYILGEINCSCVGFTSPEEFMAKIAVMVGDNIVEIVSEKKA
ncbi:MAG: Cj0069 family protein [Helicobacter sp.]|uniref:Cj0069 family protein n=1 Tax=Helicobacter sp. TaxID=218 RepID=UPI0023C557F0|nr:Cj0069 family protein [Helicobacter sp.]MDE5925268.1 Cj0069 family protein [Helicobacter sp.]MDE7175785.1 Cj0069 family protein [Helicobacter sp.]